MTKRRLDDALTSAEKRLIELLEGKSRAEQDEILGGIENG